MAKAKVQYICSECGTVSIKWSGQCPDCQSWNTLNEETVGATGTDASRLRSHLAGPAQVRSLDNLDFSEEPRQGTGMAELDRVIGGGLVPGSVILIGGDPGI